MWYRNMMYGWGGWPMMAGFALPLFLLVIVFDLVLRGMALWKSAGSRQKGWFIALLIINSVGILPIIYLLFFQKKSKKK